MGFLNDLNDLSLRFCFVPFFYKSYHTASEGGPTEVLPQVAHLSLLAAKSPSTTKPVLQVPFRYCGPQFEFLALKLSTGTVLYSHGLL